MKLRSKLPHQKGYLFMKIVATLLCLLLGAASVDAVEQKPASIKRSTDSSSRKTDKGLYTLEISIPGGGLATGSNKLDITLRDKGGKEVEGAKLTVVPWLTDKNHGVWEKPAITERGGGKYHADNVAIAMTGRWELRISVAKGGQEDRAVFTYSVTKSEKTTTTRNPKGAYKKTLHRYTVPNVTLLNQDGKKVNIRSLIDSGKPVIIDFIYTTCNTICPVLSASFTNLRRELGKDAEKVQLISISIDPEHDRPEQMKKYLSRFTKGKGWDFLTGSKEDIYRVLQSLDAVVSDKMAHEPIYLIHGSHADEWVRLKGLLGKTDLLAELREVENR